MAKMTIKGLDEYAKKLDRLGKQAPEISRKAVYAGASVVADKMRENLEKNLRDPTYVGKNKSREYAVKQKESTGELSDSMGIAPITTDAQGNTNTKIGFEGYDKKGVPNALKARSMESGTSVLRKRPFARPAVLETKEKAQRDMGKVVDEEISKIYAL
nr:MAG TPA: tail component [Caudoviricetes sp.]